MKSEYEKSGASVEKGEGGATSTEKETEEETSSTNNTVQPKIIPVDVENEVV